ncbi:uncharacterized protein LOC117316812 [Pecten maximus]|uniref:uncharacterized protein LOC117316812 n=1 Tax=Pecten maximus TaxID=6579 RepID=UPI001458BA51|nr:uncharacterized protein LOC117316812 [Pecten maximus]
MRHLRVIYIKKTGSDNIYDLSGIRGTEADIRILLDAVLIPFAEEMELTIETEKSYKNKNLPNCKFDYRLRYKNDVVGLVEAKSRLYGNGLGPESVVQGILQLSALQAEVYGRRSKTLSSKQLSPLPFFNIISDGFQFIFMQLDHDELRFDHQPGRNVFGDDMSTLRLYIMDSREQIENILERLAKLMFQIIRSIDQTEEEEKEEVEEEEETEDEGMEVYETDEDGTIILD